MLIHLEGMLPWAVWFQFAQDKRGVAEDACEGVIEIERNRAGKLEGAIQFLFMRGAGIHRIVF